jgi:hypothetical protein
MSQLIYALQFRGLAAPTTDNPAVLVVAATASSRAATSTIGDGGLTSETSDVDGGMAAFESKVSLNDDNSFEETGTITFGEGNSLTFSTVGSGSIRPSAEESIMHGAVVWQIEGGIGQFAGASGLITSNFTVNSEGNLVDNQYGVIWLK